MMSLHSSKELALLQLTNCMPSCNVKTIKELSDGKILVSIIETAFPERTHNLHTFHDHEHSKDEDKAVDQDSNMKENDSQNELNSVVDSSKVAESAVISNESIAAETKDTVKSRGCDIIDVVSVAQSRGCDIIDVVSVAQSLEQISIDGKDVISTGDNESSLPVKNVSEVDNNLSIRYEFIECFIDEKYNLQSGKLINYKSCKNSDELELAKVTFFVVSEVVRHYVQLNNAVIQTLSHLDMKVQQDLEECFNLFINERAKITQEDLNKLLSSHALYKVSPSKSSFITPRRSCASKYKRSPSPSTSPFHDSVFLNSPLKTYFESPIFTKKDIITKDKEILKTRQTLYEEEIKSSTLQLKVEELEKKLNNKEREIKRLKTRIKDLEENEKLEDCENCQVLLEKLKETKEQLCEAGKAYITQRDNFDDELYNYKLEIKKGLWQNKVEADEAEERCKMLEAELEDVKFELFKKGQDLEHLAEELGEKTKECEIIKEKLSAALTEIEKIPEYSIRGESIGGVIEKENEELRHRINQLELIALSKEKSMVDAMVNCTEDSFDCQVENSIFSNNELPPTQNICENTESVINSENSNINNFSPNKKDCVGALWLQYNDSMTESESTNETHLLESCVSKVLSSLQKFETEFFKQNDKRKKITSRANGSNGLVSSPVIKKLREDLKSVKKSLSCLSQVVKKSDVKFENNILIPNSSEVINENDCDSNLVNDFTCDTCLKRKDELPDSVQSSVNEDSAALKEKIKEFDILNEQYMATVASLSLMENDLNTYKRKYFLEKKEHLNNVEVLRDLEITCQQLQSELKDLRKVEHELQRDFKKEKYLFKLQLKDTYEKLKRVTGRYESLQARTKKLSERNQKLENDLVSYRSRNEELKSHIKFLENHVEELTNVPKSVPVQNANTELQPEITPYTQAIQDQMENFAPRIIKTEPLSPSEYEASSLHTDAEGSITASALYSKNLQNPFQLHTADEESFLNHSSIAGLSRNYESEDSVNRVQELNRRNTLCMPQYEAYIPNQIYELKPPNRALELNRRNTLCMPHLRSCYPAEGAPLIYPNHHSSNYVDFENPEGAMRDNELGNKEPPGKKRKVCKIKSEDLSTDVVCTPSSSKISSLLRKKTPRSLHKLIKFAGRRNQRTVTIKPKPE